MAGQVTMTVTAPVPLATLEATLERVTYANEDNGYTVAKVDPGRGCDLVTVVGSLLGAQPGEALRLRGRWSAHPQYGRQFHVEDYTTVLPATVQGILRYLGSGLIKGIGPKLAKKIVDHFGVASLDLIETTPQRLIEVPNLGPKRTRLITNAWQEQKTIKEVMVFLQASGVSTSLAVRIYKQYGDGSIGVVRTEPYRLASDVWGIGFKTADTIAQAVGVPALAAGLDRRPVRRRVHPPGAAHRRPPAGGEHRHLPDQGRRPTVPDRGDDRRLVGDCLLYTSDAADE